MRRKIKLTVYLAGRPYEVEGYAAPVGAGSFVIHRHPERVGLFCLSHAGSGMVFGTATRQRTLADGIRLAWRGIKRRSRDLIRGRAKPRARPPKANTD